MSICVLGLWSSLSDTELQPFALLCDHSESKQSIQAVVAQWGDSEVEVG